MGEVLSYGKAKIDALLAQLRSDSDGKYALKTDIPSGGGASVGGTTVCDMWNLAKTSWSAGKVIARPSGGFDFRKLNGGGPRMGFKLTPQTDRTTDPTYGWTQTDTASLIVGDTGWFFLTLAYQLSFYNNAPAVWNVNFTYPGQDYGHFPSFNITKLPNGTTIQEAFAYQPIHLNAGDEIQLQAQNVGNGDVTGIDDLGSSQFALSLTTMAMESSGVWTPDPADTSIHFIP